MLYYDCIDVFEGIDVNKLTAPKQCIICQYCYFLDKVFEFQLYNCNGCHDVLMISMNYKKFLFQALLVFNHCYCCIINGISKSEAVNLLQNADLSDKSRSF